MKTRKLIIPLILMFLSITSFGQVMPESFLGMLPKIPGSACSKETETRMEFMNRIEEVKELIEIEISSREEENDSNSDELEKQAMKKYAQQYGLSENELKKLQDEDLSDEESDELIDKALQNSSNLSLGEVKNLDKMSDKGQKAWAEAYSTEKMAEVQSAPSDNEIKQLKTKSLYELTVLQKHLLDSIGAIESKFKQQFDEIKRDPEAKVMLDNISRLKSQLIGLMGEGNDAEGKAVGEKLDTEKAKYCNKYTPKYINILERYESYTKSCLSTCYRLELISARQTELQTGVEMKQQPGLLGIKKVSDYLGMLGGVYQYNLFEN
jgi:hypothetical protein